jgi:hypothetical protein
MQTDFHHGLLCDYDTKLDVGRRVVAGCDGEVAIGAVDNTRGHHNLKLLSPELEATALASTTTLGPRFAATTTVDAGAACRHVQRHRDAVMRLAGRESDCRPQRPTPLICEKRAPNTIDGRCHRRKIDDDLIREATRFQTAVDGDADGHRSRTERTKGLTLHEQS